MADTSAPTAAPAAAPAAPIAATPHPDSGIRSTPNLDASFAELDSLYGGTPTPTPAPPKPKTDDTPNPDDAPLDPPPEKPADKPDDVPKADDKKSAAPKPPKAASLREAYDKLKQERAELDRKLSEYQEKEKAWKPNEDREKEYTAKLTAAEKRAQELEEAVKFSDYSRSTEYQEQFVKPFNEAYERGQKLAAQYNITDGDGNTRKATAEDFNAIMAISDPDTAAAKIEELFGTGVKASAILNARDSVLAKFEARNNALNEWKTKGGEREKIRTQQQEAFQKELVKDWGDSVRSGQEGAPEIFRPVEGDNEGNDILERGYRLADLAFGALPAAEFEKLPDFVKKDLKDGQLHPKARVRLHAAIRNKAGAFDRVRLQNKQLSAKVKELQAKVDGYKKSEPGIGTVPGVASVPSKGGTLADVDAIFDAFAAGRR